MWRLQVTCNGWIAGSPIDPASGQEPHASGVSPCQQGKAVQLNLLNPAVASRRVRGWARQARFDEASQAGTHTQHGRLISRSNDYCNSTMIVSAMARRGG